MSNPTTPGHDYVRPGQVAPDLPPPDNCMRCGQSEATHRAGTYSRAASDADTVLDERLMNIRFTEAAGDLTPAEAAALRVEAMEEHLKAIRLLRALFFGTDIDDDIDHGWMSGTCGRSA